MTKQALACMVFVALVSLSPRVRAYPALPTPTTEISKWYGVNIQKTVEKLLGGEPVKIVWFGQSLCMFNKPWTRAGGRSTSAPRTTSTA